MPEEVAVHEEVSHVGMLKNHGDVAKIVLKDTAVGGFAAVLGNEGVHVVQPRWVVIIGQQALRSKGSEVILWHNQAEGKTLAQAFLCESSHGDVGVL